MQYNPLIICVKIPKWKTSAVGTKNSTRTNFSTKNSYQIRLQKQLFFNFKFVSRRNRGASS
ncbi:hypothetical protein Hanom_Chr14g01309491 [Helianthus anomalus]